MPRFVWATLATGGLTLAASIAHTMRGYFIGNYTMPQVSDVGFLLLLSAGIVFMFWLWQTPKTS